MGTTDLLLSRLEKELGRIARERIAKGQMPREAPTRFWGGFGTGRPCALCDKPIQSDEIEYEVNPIRPYKRFDFTESAITHGSLSVPA